MSWFMISLRNYAVFSGRSQRSEYWYFALFYLIFYVVLAVLDGLTGTLDVQSGIGLFTGIFALGLLLPSLAVSVRRLHDTGRSGWWLLIGIIPLIGTIVLIVFLAQDGEPSANRFGANPKEGTPGRMAGGTGAGTPWEASRDNR